MYVLNNSTGNKYNPYCRNSIVIDWQWVAYILFIIILLIRNLKHTILGSVGVVSREKLHCDPRKLTPD